jgi:hypothetical protein
MRRILKAVLISGASFAMAQTPGGNPGAQNPPVTQPAPAQPVRPAAVKGPGPAAPGSAKTADVSPNTPIVTFEGLCRDPKAKGPCNTVITREDLDRFVNAFSPAVSAPVRSRLAVQYARILAFSVLAEQQGFDKDPALSKEIDAQLKLIRMRILATAFLEILQKDAPVSNDEIQKFYDEHREQYQQAQVRRISVPLELPNETGKPLDRAKVTAAMQEFQKRAAAGEDLNKLQQEVYQRFHIQTAAPAVSVTALQRTRAQGEEAKAFDLKPGEVSPVLDLPTSVAIIKLESKGPIPPAEARAQVEAWLRGNLSEGALGQLVSNVKTEFNLQYLDLASQPDLFGVGTPSPVAQATPKPSSTAKP